MVYKFSKEQLKNIDSLLNNGFSVNNYHQTLLRSALNDFKNNNLQKASFEIIDLLINQYKNSGVLI